MERYWDWDGSRSDRLHRPLKALGCWCWKDTLGTMAAHRRMARTGCPSKMTRSTKGGDRY